MAQSPTKLSGPLSALYIKSWSNCEGWQLPCNGNAVRLESVTRRAVAYVPELIVTPIPVESVANMHRCERDVMVCTSGSRTPRILGVRAPAVEWIRRVPANLQA